VLNAEELLAQAAAQSLSGAAALYKALGGGWSR